MGLFELPKVIHIGKCVGGGILIGVCRIGRYVTLL
jgi:hypothetical protein